MNYPHDKKFNVGVLGGTGIVGQTFIYLLSKHENFVLKKISSSEKKKNKNFLDVTKWKILSNIKNQNFLSNFILVSSKPENFLDCDFVFSALGSDIAEEIEKEFMCAGIPVFSNAKNYRMNKYVPILIPMINLEHLEIIKQQPYFNSCNVVDEFKKQKKKGFIVTNANCSVTGLSIALAPLEKAYGIESVIVTTMQSISGGGYPGVPSIDILGNIIPYIEDEEDKIKNELKKILGNVINGEIMNADIKVSAACNRVPVDEGHFLTVSVRLKNKEICKKNDEEFISDILSTYADFSAPKSLSLLPSFPDKVIKIFQEVDRPQTKFDRYTGDGMTTCIGRIRRCEVLDLKMVILSHNTIMGAAGNSILNAELCVMENLI